MKKISVTSYQYFYPFIIILVFLSFFNGLNADAQGNLIRKTDIPVFIGENQLDFAWVGGLNTPQFSEVDLNNDNLLDLFIFDRGDHNVICFITEGSGADAKYVYAPEFESQFPILSDFAKMIDFNCDNIPDLFGSFDGDGVRVWQGSYTADNLMEFTIANEKLSYPDGDSNTNLQVSKYDIPAINDIDNDGDLDILTFNPSGGFIEYFKNNAIENGDCALLEFDKTAHCWGNFYESGISKALVLDTCGTDVAVPRIEDALHPGSTLLAIDLDGDSDKEMILGDISFDNLVLATNGGTSEDAFMISQDTIFPSYNIPASLRTFPAAFEADINRDGLKDILVSPNARIQSQNHNCVWYYKNVGSETESLFQWETDSLFVDEMIDLNRYSHPEFFDHNSDGLLDLVVSNFGYEISDGIFVSELSLYENIGTATSPEFKLVSKNWGNVQNQFFQERKYLRPTFGDIDGDGDEDMLVGDKDGFIHLFTNEPTAEGIANMVLNPGGEQYKGIDIYQATCPQFIDLNNDDLLDLVIGFHAGGIEYWENIGTATNAEFEKAHDQPLWGNVDVKSQGAFNGHAAPRIFDFNGEKMLVVGSESGNVHLYNDIENNLYEGSFNQITTNFGDVRGLSYSSPLAKDIDDDGRLDYLFGTFRGGLVWYEESSIDNSFALEIKSIVEAQILTDFQSNTIVLQWDSPTENSNLNFKVFNELGQIVSTKKISNSGQINLELANLSQGIYFLQLQTENGLDQKVLKFIRY